MEALVSGLIVLALIFLFLGSGTWVWAGLLLVSVSGLVLILDWPMHRVGVTISKIVLRSASAWELAAIPMFVWMGETDPVPLEEDLPMEMVEERNHFYVRTRVWSANWTEPMNQGIDFHEAYLHRAQFKWLGGTRPKS